MNATKLSIVQKCIKKVMKESTEPITSVIQLEDDEDSDGKPIKRFAINTTSTSYTLDIYEDKWYDLYPSKVW